MHINPKKNFAHVFQNVVKQMFEINIFEYETKIKYTSKFIDRNQKVRKIKNCHHFSVGFNQVYIQILKI